MGFVFFYFFIPYCKLIFVSNTFLKNSLLLILFRLDFLQHCMRVYRRHSKISKRFTSPRKKKRKLTSKQPYNISPITFSHSWLWHLSCVWFSFFLFTSSREGGKFTERVLSRPCSAHKVCVRVYTSLYTSPPLLPAPELLPQPFTKPGTSGCPLSFLFMSSSSSLDL